MVKITAIARYDLSPTNLLKAFRASGYPSFDVLIIVPLYGVPERNAMKDDLSSLQYLIKKRLPLVLEIFSNLLIRSTKGPIGTEPCLLKDNRIQLTTLVR